MLKDRSADEEPVTVTDTSREPVETVPPALTSDMMKVLDTHGISREKLAEVMSGLQINSDSHAIGDISMAINEKSANADQLELSENARVILAKRYLIRDDNGQPAETAEGLFHRVANAIAQGEKTPALQQQWGTLFYNLMTSLKFLPNSPTLVNAGTDGKGCLSACFVVSQCFTQCRGLAKPGSRGVPN